MHIRVPIYSIQTLQDLLNLLFEKYLKNEVEIYSYGKTWEIRTMATDKKRIEKLAAFDTRDIKDCGIQPGEQYAIN
jgi:chromosome segregation and condensation protein ScpB